ncbi:MAG: carbohydrate ABC transporter substrate-binding protein [Alphaproteobacteria bacterium]|nr:carbohydrate ABC transporter substrate-binding protein [Alphaproteobacteria bacterium]
MVKSSPITRRGALKLGAAATALPLVHIRSGRAAGKLSVAFWDHWVPKGNDVLQSQVNDWAKQNQVDVTVDFITGNGGKLQTTGVAESMAKTGHDIFTFAQWDVHNVAQALAPVDDLMKRIIAKNGAVNEIATYLAKSQGHWAAVPTTTGTQTKPPCARISWFKKNGLDVQAMYPVKPEHTALQDAWTYDELMKYAEIAKKDDMTFALGLGGFTNTDGIDQVGAMFRAYGAALVDKEGTIQVKSDAMKQFLEFAQKMVKFYPDSAPSFDDASNNRALISGKSALIFNPPSAWAVAKRDAPQVAADCWTFSAPSGPKGRFVPVLIFFWGIWSFSQNKKPAAELIEYLLERKQAEARSNVVDGYDIPPYANMLDFKIWETVEPPPGTVYNYPIRPWHKAEPSLTASEAQPDVAVQIYNRAVHNNMLAQLKGGKSIPEVIAWAQNELEGFVR